MCLRSLHHFLVVLRLMFFAVRLVLIGRIASYSGIGLSFVVVSHSTVVAPQFFHMLCFYVFLFCCGVFWHCIDLALVLVRWLCCGASGLCYIGSSASLHRVVPCRIKLY